jgi:hypothetical protein
MRNVNSRRGQTSITHLMNFSLPPRPQYTRESYNRSSRRITYGLGSGHHAVDKARYVWEMKGWSLANLLMTADMFMRITDL